MATRTSGKSGARGEKKTTAGKGTGAARKPASGSKSAARRPKTSAKQTSGNKKKKKRAKSKRKESFLTRHKAYILGLSLGLLIGCLGAVAILYLPDAVTTFKKEANVRDDKKSVRKDKKFITPKRIVYEEEHHFEELVKKLDREIYSAFNLLKVPDRDINFLEVTQKRTGEHEWYHALLEVDLPQNVSVDKAAKAVQASLKKVDHKPRPRVRKGKGGGGKQLKITLGDVHTHTINLNYKQGPATALKPVKVAAVNKKRANREKKTNTGLRDNQFEKNKPAEKPNKIKPKVAIVIDDFGENTAQARNFLQVKFPLTFSVLPFLPHSRDVAGMAHENGRTVMLHMPMQPSQWPGVDAGPGVLLVNMGRPEIEKRLKEALASVPYVEGVNNHMGSRFTEDRIRMKWVLEIIGKRGMFFLDSRTSTRTSAFSEARRLGIPTAYRHVFLDNIQEPQAIRIQLRKLVAHARQNGKAVGIGHVYPVTCQVLKREYNYLNSKVDLVSMTDLIGK